MEKTGVPKRKKKRPAYQTHSKSKPHNDSWSAIWEFRTNQRLVIPLGIKIQCNTGTAAYQGCGYKVLN